MIKDKGMDKVELVLSQIKPVDQKIRNAAQKKLDCLTKPPGSLGELEEIAKRVVAITGSLSPCLQNKKVVVMAADHGVTEEEVNPYPQEITAQMVNNFLSGGAAINVLARHVGAQIVLVDMGVVSDLSSLQGAKDRKIGHGTANMAQGPAMTTDQAIQCLVAGIEVVEEELSRTGVDLLATGDMGIGNTTPSSAIAAVLCPAPVEEVTGRGTGADDKMLNHKVKVIKRAIERNQPDSADPIGVLAKVGGFEIGGLAGCILGAAAHRKPVVIDGFISGAAALIAVGLKPEVKDYLIAGHRSAEIGHQVVLEKLGLKPVLDLGMRLGEGTGAVLAMEIVEAAVKILEEMATFEEAGVSQAKE